MYLFMYIKKNTLHIILYMWCCMSLFELKLYLYNYWPLLVDVGLKFERAEMQVIGWMWYLIERQKDK